VSDTVDLELVTIERLAELPKRPLRELWPDALTPLDCKVVYVYRAPTKIGGQEYVKRFVEQT
jgi:hypothetical protein